MGEGCVWSRNYVHRHTGHWRGSAAYRQYGQYRPYRPYSVLSARSHAPRVVCHVPAGLPLPRPESYAVPSRAILPIRSSGSPLGVYSIGLELVALAQYTLSIFPVALGKLFCCSYGTVGLRTRLRYSVQRAPTAKSQSKSSILGQTASCPNRHRSPAQSPITVAPESVCEPSCGMVSTIANPII